MDAIRLYSLLERLGNLLRAELRVEASHHGLPLVQLEALHYLAMCNRYSDTPAAVADFFGATKGTTSQSLSSLVGKGLVAKVPDPGDARVVHCQLTERGRAIVEATLPPTLVAGVCERAIASRDRADQRAGVADAADGPTSDVPHALEYRLAALLRALQSERGGRTFGECRTCGHFRRQDDAFRCGLIGDPLTAGDSRKICREHALVVLA